MIDLEEELLIAKEVSIRLHSELEQAQEWRNNTDQLNKELKKQLDELKDYLDNEVCVSFFFLCVSNLSNSKLKPYLYLPIFILEQTKMFTFEAIF